MTDDEREIFDELVEDAIDQLPPRIRSLLDEVPVVVLDRPTPDMLKDLGIDPANTEEADEICGLHTGTAFTEQTFERPELTSNIHLFRIGIVALAGGWDDPDQEKSLDNIFEEIWVTLLHEIGHQFGLDEDDLEKLGYD
jgi:predicted Zn-dependent protease with MMP-like domain